MFETSCNLASHRIIVLNKATVDVPGVTTSLLWRPCKHELHLFGGNKSVYIGLPKVAQTGCGSPSLLERFAEVPATLCDGAIIHIGVGSDVVCSFRLGNARALTRGTDNRTISRSFYVLN